MRSELTGRRFGKLTAIEPTDQRKRGAVIWRCHCDCGNEVLVESRRLKPGVIQSCGCDNGISVQKDLVGQRFGQLAVIEKTEKRSKNRYVIWKCRCDCGNFVEVTKDKLLSGNVSSCGCGRRPPLKDFAGKRFGNLEVIAYAGKAKGFHLWKCRCDCGNIVEVLQSNLQAGCSTSCGCKHYPPGTLHFVEGTCVELIQSKKLSKANTSGIRGVYYDRRRSKWIAQIMFKRKCYYLGGYDKLEDAAKARARGEEMFDDFLERYHQEYQTDVRNSL